MANLSPTPILLTEKNLPHLASRPLDAHKGLFGHVLIVGGDFGTSGAPLLAAEIALRTGAGLVSVATRPENILAILTRTPEIMCLGIQSANQLSSLINKASVIVVGVGLGQSVWSQSLLSAVASSNKPQIWDADALNFLAQNKVIVPKGSILTPHLAEAARLLNTEIETIQKDKIYAATQLRQQYDCHIVLKGRGTLIAGLDGSLTICDNGHPAMAGAGFGDVLSGLIGALSAQHLSPVEASQLAVWLHAQAGEQLGALGRGLVASDLATTVRQLLEKQSPCL